MADLLTDLRFAIRSLARQPGFTVLAVVTLALGIGVNSAMFSVAHGVLLEPLPYAEADRLLLVWRLIDGETEASFSFPVVDDLAERQRAFAALASFRGTNLNLTGALGEPERLHGLMVSAEMLPALGIEPTAGRGFDADDDRPGAAPTALVSHELWSRRFAADPDLLGDTVSLDGISYTVVGVLPPGLARRQLGSYPLGDVWVPLGLFRDRLPPERESSIGLIGLGRLRPGAGVDDGRADIERIGRELTAEHPLIHGRSTLVTVPVRDDAVGEVRPALMALSGTVALVLLIACANLTNLLLVRAAARRREFAARSALGAAPGRLVRQVLTETAVLALAGGALGLLVARLALAFLPRLAPAALGATMPALDGTAVAFTVFIALLAAALSGLVPALESTRARLNDALAAPAAPRPRLRRLLVAGELALALALLIGAALMLGSLSRLGRVDPGFEPGGVLGLQLTLPATRYPDPAAVGDFFARALAEVEALPGVRSAAATTTLPLVLGTGNMSICAVGDRPLPPTPEMAITVFQQVSSDYFRTLGIPLTSGRGFEPTDDDRLGARRVAIISRSLARHFWPDRDPLGERIAFEFEGDATAPEPQWRTVVGVVGDVRLAGLEAAPEHTAYAPLAQPILWFEDEPPTMALTIATEGDPRALGEPVRRRLLALDPQQPVHDVAPLAEAVDAQLGLPRRTFVLLATFALLALALAVVGVYGILSQMVAAGRREIGTRMALGAEPRQVLAAVLGPGLVLIAAGLALGLAAAAAFSRLLTSQLYDAPALEPVAYAGSALVLGAVAVLAILVPAWRATRVAPAEALRLH